MIKHMDNSINKCAHRQKIKQLLVLLLSAATLTTLLLVGLAGCKKDDPVSAAGGLSAETYESYVSIESSTNQTEYGTTHVYVVKIAPEASWSEASDEQRKEITDKAITECRAKADADGTSSYTIVGLTGADYSQNAFSYNRDLEEVTIYANGVPTGTKFKAPGY